MTTPQISTGQAGGTAPVACALTPDDMAAQADHWQRLMARTMTERTETRMACASPSAPSPGRTKNCAGSSPWKACCAWADWTVSMSAGARPQLTRPWPIPCGGDRSRDAQAVLRVGGCRL